MKRIALLFCICIVSQVAVAQCKFTMSLSINGCSNSLDGRVAERTAESLFNHYMEQIGIGFNSLQECNTARNIVISELNMTYGNCRIRVNVSPCSGCSGRTNSADILAIGQGGGFYSTNGSNEIRDWSNDDMERMLALNNEYQNMTPSMLTTGDDAHDQRLAMLNDNINDFEDYMIVGGARIPVSVLNKPFISVNMREDFNKVEMANDFSLLANKDNVQRYVDASKGLFAPYLANPQDLTRLLHMEFKTVSGFDVDAIMQKLPSERTEAEKQALIDYQAYRKKTTEIMLEEAKSYIDNMEEKKEIDRAILAIAAYPKKEEYRTDNNGFVENTNFQRKDPSSFSDLEDPMRSVASALEVCNKFEDGTGFHAELYYNEKTNTYVIACAGSDDWDDWFWNNAVNAVGDFDKRFDEIPQYNMAKTIADEINRIPSEIREKLNIEIVGHSLGGGVASIIGLATGLKTTTYNAARVPERILKEKELLDKVNNNETGNITAYHTSTDILTSTQNFFKTPAIGTSIDIGDPSTEAERKEMRSKGAKYGAAAGGLLGAIGGATLAEKINGHDMSLVLRGVSTINTGKNEARLQRYLNRQASLYREANSIEYQTQESIRIFTGS